MGVTTDMAKAMSYYRTGAEKGNSDCQTSLGLFYQAGERIPGGAKADPVEAVKWYKLAAEQNHEEAIQHLAMMNARGMGIEQNDLEAVRWFRKGAELGNADCKWGLGQCYFDGKGVAKDNVQAYALWVAAIDGAEDPEQKKGMSEQLDKLGKEMTPEQVARGQELSKEWIAKKNKE
jgi:TPR repeat protein